MFREHLEALEWLTSSHAQALNQNVRQEGNISGVFRVTN